MDIICMLLGGVLTYALLLKPLATYNEKKRKKTFQRYYRHFQLLTVQNHYPQLHELTLREIESLYNVSEAYNRIR